MAASTRSSQSRRCGYAYYGKATPGLAERHRPDAFGYGAYRCIGSDGHRFDGQAVCANRPVRSDRLERAVWAQIEVVLNDSERVAHEYREASRRGGRRTAQMPTSERSSAASGPWEAG